MKKKLRLQLLLLVISFLVPVFAASASAIYVKEVKVEGAVRVPQQTIYTNLRMKPGVPFDREGVSQDVRHLFEMGAFQDIQVFSEETVGGVRLVYKIVEKPIIGKVTFHGNKKIKTDDLQEKVKVNLYQPFDEKKFVESITGIQEAYEKKNYYLMEIAHRFQAMADGNTELIFDIHERSPTYIRQVQFIGNKVFTDAELRDIVKTKKRGGFSFLSGSGKYKEEQIKQDVMRLTFHYLKNGYIKVNVEPASVYLTKDRRYFFVTFKIQEGDRYHVGKVDVSGDILTTREELLQQLQTKQGQIYNRELIEGDIQKMEYRYGDQGYAFAHVRPLTNLDEVAKTADLDFHVEKGNRVRIEKIEIEGNTITRDKVIRRELKIKEGDIYSESRLAESREKVQALGFFKQVNFATPRGSTDDAVILKISVEEQPTGSFNIGAGFSTAENFIFSGSIQKNNFFGYGISGQISAEMSKIRQQFELDFTDPYFLDSEWMLGTSAFRSVYQFNDFDRESYGGSVSIGHRFFDHASITLGYDAEQVKVTSFSTTVPELFRANTSGLTSDGSLLLARDTRDNRIFARKGTLNSLKLEYSGKALGGDNDFFRVTGRTQYYQPVIWGITLKGFGRIGYVDSLSNKSVPLFERFFMGGVNSLRGYFPQSVGPRLRIPVSDSSGDSEFVYGGNKMWITNLELELPIYDPAGLRFVSFYDVGNSFAEDENFSITKVRQDYGFGLRWVSPMGPLRFEWGIPINPRPGESDLIFNFTIGQFF